MNSQQEQADANLRRIYAHLYKMALMRTNGAAFLGDEFTAQRYERLQWSIRDRFYRERRRLNQ
jgi:hypothetical protein